MVSGVRESCSFVETGLAVIMFSTSTPGSSDSIFMGIIYTSLVFSSPSEMIK